MSTPPALLLLAPALLSACAAAGDGTPSLAPRAAEYELSGRPVPPCIAGAASGAPVTPAEAPPPADAQLAARVEALLADARQGQADFAALLPRAQASAARAGAAGTETWIAAQQELSRLEAARARTAAALAELDALILERLGARAANPQDLERLTAATEEVRGLAETQEAEIDTLDGALNGASALRHAPSPARRNAQRPPAARQARAAPDRAHISPAAQPKAVPTGSSCRA
jgi:hypothetical protein